MQYLAYILRISVDLPAILLSLFLYSAVKSAKMKEANTKKIYIKIKWGKKKNKMPKRVVKVNNGRQYDPTTMPQCPLRRGSPSQALELILSVYSRSGIDNTRKLLFISFEWGELSTVMMGRLSKYSDNNCMILAKGSWTDRIIPDRLLP